MVNSRRPLEEKIALFWHHVFATAIPMEHPPSAYGQIETFRRVGLSNMGTILTALSRDPAMIFWLDNNENHHGEPNENYGRELLELFSMGVGNYTEDDIKMAARAFTGWTFRQPLPLYPHGHYPAAFTYVEDDHDDSAKTFLGETGRFNGEDIIDIVVRQRATAAFVSRHLYNFFVADEAQVPAWSVTPPRDPDAIETLVEAYMESNGEIRSVLRVLFESDFFKEARFRRVKCPTELVTGVLKLVGTYRAPAPGISAYARRHGRNGPGPSEPADRGGLAHRQGVDRRGDPQRTGQLRGQRGRRRRQAGDASPGGPAEVGWSVASGGPVRRKMPRPDRPRRGRRRNAAGADAVRGFRRAARAGRRRPTSGRARPGSYAWRS